MKRFWVLLFILLGLGVFVYRQNVTDFFYNSPCNNPIPYKIGSVDPKFGLSSAEVLANTKTAADILNTAENKQLFVYSDTATLTVNFVYDQRAALSTQIDQLKAQLSQKDSTLTQQVNDYKAQANQFEQKLSDFNATVKKYNKEGGVSLDVFNSLTDQQKQLQAEAGSLNQKARLLKLSTHEYNMDVSTLNQDTAQFNNEIALKPEEGLFDSGKHTITIYFAGNHNELIHTLTHEFGHALGMQHVNNAQAIMYPYSTTFLTPTSEDLEQLAYVCRKQPLPLRWVQVLRMAIVSLAK